MPSTFISQRTWGFDYFDQQLDHPDWADKRVLDFGGNAGNLLRSVNNKVAPSLYWCIDPSRDAIALGQRLHPDAHLVHYDRYSIAFNPTGVRGLPIPDLGCQFDVILAFSVFTHTSKQEMLDLVNQLRKMLACGGVLAFTFIDPYWVSSEGVSNIQWMVDRAVVRNPTLDADELLARIHAAELTWMTFVNSADLHLDPDDSGIEESMSSRRYLTLCTTEYMRRLYPDAVIREPVGSENQHCCLLRK